MPITSWAPKFAEINASPVTHAGSERPERKKSVLVRVDPPQDETDAQDEHEVDQHDRPVDERQIHGRFLDFGDERISVADRIAAPAMPLLPFSPWSLTVVL